MVGRRYLYSNASVSQAWMESSLKHVIMVSENGRKKTFWDGRKQDVNKECRYGQDEGTK